MSVVHPPKHKVDLLSRRWDGQEKRLEAIARDLRAGRDWTVHLGGLPYVDEIPPLPGEVYGRDLRGADLRRHLRPAIVIETATEHEAALVAGISLEGLRNNTALPDASPFPMEVEGASELALAMRRGERFLLARCDGEPVGVVRIAERREFTSCTEDRPYIELSGLSVLPRWRRTGIGARLLQTAEACASEDGHAWVLLRTTLEVGLVPWYTANGYEQRHVRQLAYPDAPTCLDVVMTKRLGVVGPSMAVRRSAIVRSDGSRARPNATGIQTLVGYRGNARAP